MTFKPVMNDKSRKLAKEAYNQTKSGILRDKYRSPAIKDYIENKDRELTFKPDLSVTKKL